MEAEKWYYSLKTMMGPGGIKPTSFISVGEQDYPSAGLA
jgi:hypothetical protein